MNKIENFSRIDETGNMKTFPKYCIIKKEFGEICLSCSSFGNYPYSVIEGNRICRQFTPGVNNHIIW